MGEPLDAELTSIFTGPDGPGAEVDSTVYVPPCALGYIAPGVEVIFTAICTGVGFEFLGFLAGGRSNILKLGGVDNVAPPLTHYSSTVRFHLSCTTTICLRFALPIASFAHG